jgi:hypothetical protein
MNLDLAIARTQIEIAKLCLLLQAEEGKVIETTHKDQFGNPRTVARVGGKFASKKGSSSGDAGQEQDTEKIGKAAQSAIASVQKEISKLPDDIAISAEKVSKNFKNLFTELGKKKPPKFLTEPLKKARDWGEERLKETQTVGKKFLQDVAAKAKKLASPENLKKSRKSAEAALAMGLAVGVIFAAAAITVTGVAALGGISGPVMGPLFMALIFLDHGRTPLEIYKQIDKSVEDWLGKREKAKKEKEERTKAVSDYINKVETKAKEWQQWKAKADEALANFKEGGEFGDPDYAKELFQNSLDYANQMKAEGEALLNQQLKDSQDKESQSAKQVIQSLVEWSEGMAQDAQATIENIEDYQNFIDKVPEVESSMKQASQANEQAE